MLGSKWALSWLGWCDWLGVIGRSAPFGYYKGLNLGAWQPFGPGPQGINRPYVLKDGDANALILKGAAGAREWWQIHQPRILEARDKITELANEPPVGTREQRLRLAEWTVEVCRLIRQADSGIRIAVGVFARGTPQLRIADSSTEALAELRPVFEAGDYTAIHSYGLRRLSEGSTWHVLRHRALAAELRERGIRFGPFLITEFGHDLSGVESGKSGYRTWGLSEAEVWADYAWFDAQVREDPDVACVCPFVFGADAKWAAFDLGRGIAEQAAAAVRAHPPRQSSTPVKEKPMSNTIRLWQRSAGKVIALPLEEYLRGVVPAEMPASWPLEALKAQAVAARTYALAAIQRPRHAEQGADLCDTAQCQAHSGTHYARSNQAVAETAGVVWDNPCQYVSRCGRPDCPLCRGANGYNGQTWTGRLCQWGAKHMAEQGKNYREILALYYGGEAMSGFIEAARYHKIRINPNAALWKAISAKGQVPGGHEWYEGSTAYQWGYDARAGMWHLWSWSAAEGVRQVYSEPVVA